MAPGSPSETLWDHFLAWAENVSGGPPEALWGLFLAWARKWLQEAPLRPSRMRFWLEHGNGPSNPSESLWGRSSPRSPSSFSRHSWGVSRLFVLYTNQEEHG
eukprot:12403668-Karenia_brevis.AAC.1